MPSTPQMRISKKKEQIVQTASALLMKFGFRRITVEEICRKAGASKRCRLQKAP